MSVQNLTPPQPLSLTSLWETVSAMLGPDVSVDVHRAAGSASAAVVAPGQLWPERESDDWQNRIHVGVVQLLNLGTFRYFLDATFRSGRVGQHITTLLEGTPA